MSKRKKPIAKQLTLQTLGWGGIRHGAGRPKKANAKVGHRKRRTLNKLTPLHVTLRLKKDLPNLRTKKGFKVFRKAVLGARQSGLKVLQFAILGNHFHILIEAKNNQDLARAMRSLNGRLTKAINKWVNETRSKSDDVWLGRDVRGQRKGTAFTERYHLQILSTPAQIKNAMLYIFANAAKHLKRNVIFDPYCSYSVFNRPLKIGRKSELAAKIWKKPLLSEGYKKEVQELLSRPESWLASVGWERAKVA